MPWTDAFIPVEAENFEIMKWNTWGHLAPKKNKKYKIQIVFAVSEYESGSSFIIKTIGDAPNSPWFFDDTGDWMFNISTERYDREKDQHVKPITKEGKIYKFDGYYKKSYDEDGYEFCGTLVEVKV